MGYWHYRVLRSDDGGYGVHEVHYHDDGSLRSWSARPVSLFGDSLDDLADDLLLLRQALKRPVLAERHGKLTLVEVD